VSATIERLLSNCFANVIYTTVKSSTSYISIRKATRHRLFRSFYKTRSFLLLTDVQAHGVYEFADSLVRVDH